MCFLRFQTEIDSPRYFLYMPPLLFRAFRDLVRFSLTSCFESKITAAYCYLIGHEASPLNNYSKHSGTPPTCNFTCASNTSLSNTLGSPLEIRHQRNTLTSIHQCCLTHGSHSNFRHTRILSRILHGLMHDVELYGLGIASSSILKYYIGPDAKRKWVRLVVMFFWLREWIPSRIALWVMSA